MNTFTLDFRDALLKIDIADLSQLQQDQLVQFAGMSLKPGIYGRAKAYAKAFLIVAEDGKVYYQNKNGKVSNRLTEKAFLAHWNSGMSTFISEI